MAEALLKIRTDPIKLSPRMQRLLNLTPAQLVNVMRDDLLKLAAESSEQVKRAVHTTPREADGQLIQRRTGTLAAQTGVKALLYVNGDRSVSLGLQGYSLAHYASYLESGTSRIRPWHYLARGMAPVKRSAPGRLADALRRYLSA